MSKANGKILKPTVIIQITTSSQAVSKINCFLSAFILHQYSHRPCSWEAKFNKVIWTAAWTEYSLKSSLVQSFTFSFVIFHLVPAVSREEKSQVPIATIKGRLSSCKPKLWKIESKDLNISQQAYSVKSTFFFLRRTFDLYIFGGKNPPTFLIELSNLMILLLLHHI